MRGVSVSLALAACAATPAKGPFAHLNVSAPVASGSRAPKGAQLVLRCSQPDAQVLLDGVPQGTCDDYDGEPKGLSLRPGPRRLEVKKPGFVTWQGWLEADGTRVVVDVSLSSAKGSTP